MIFDKWGYKMSKRNTKQKEIIINYLKSHKNIHLTVEEMFEGIKTNDESVGQTTIYRMINYLIKNELLIKIPLDNKQGYCYQYNEKDETCNNHYHLICESCGKLIHFESKEVDKIKHDALKEESFNINSSKIVFYGKCKKCG